MSLGYEVMLASSGAEGIELYQRYRSEIDLVILDMVMPQMDGPRTFDQLKKNDPEVRVLLSSGYSIEGQAAEMLTGGCKGFIQKPCTLQLLSDKIKKALTC